MFTYLLVWATCATALRVSKYDARATSHQTGRPRVATLEEANVCMENTKGFLSKIESSLRPEEKSALEAAFKSPGPKILIVVTRHTLCMTDNFILNTWKATNTTIAHVALDAESHDTCVKVFKQQGGPIDCIDFSAWLPEVGEEHISSIAFGGCYHHIIMWARVLAMSVALSVTPSWVLTLDTDIILHKDLVAWLDKWMVYRENSTIVLGMDPGPNVYNRVAMLNGGTMAASATGRSLFRAWLQEAGSLNEFATATATQGALDRVFQRSPDLLHGLQLVPIQYHGECAMRGKFATHYDCLDNKIDIMTKLGLYRPELPGCSIPDQASLKDVHPILRLEKNSPQADPHTDEMFEYMIFNGIPMG